MNGNQQEFALRCYVRQTGRDRTRWVGHCIELDLWAVGSSCDEAEAKTLRLIDMYIKTVLDKKDAEVARRLLLERRAPLRFSALWHLWTVVNHLGRVRDWALRPYQFKATPPLPAFG